jgi:CHASE1-domain containing sensor protein
MKKYLPAGRHGLPVVIVTVILITSTLCTWFITSRLLADKTKRVFEQDVSTVESWITNRFEIYTTIALSLQGYWAGNDNVTNEDWSKFVQRLKIGKKLPGITSISLAKKINDSYIVTYVYPPERSEGIGFNLTSTASRRETIQKTIDSETVVITDRVLLAADQSPGFALYIPMYQEERPLTNIQERRDAIEAIASIAFSSANVFKDLFDSSDPFPNMDFELYKGEVLDDNHLLYDHDQAYYIRRNDQTHLESKQTIVLNGEIFTFLASTKPSFELLTLEKILPQLVLVIGLATSLLIPTIFVFFLKKNPF